MSYNAFEWCIPWDIPWISQQQASMVDYGLFKNKLATFVGQCHIDKAYKYHSLPTHMDQKKSHLSTIRDMSYSGRLWGMVGGKAKCLQRCIISETTQSVCLCMQLPGYWLFVFLHIVSQGEEESFISAMKQSPARYPLKYYNYIWLSKPSLQILSWTRLWCNNFYLRRVSIDIYCIAQCYLC